MMRGFLLLAALCGWGTITAAAQDTARDDTVITDDGEAGTDTEEDLPEIVWLQRQTARLRGLDKITGRSTDFDVVVGEAYTFGSLNVMLQVCYQKPPEEPPESAAFLQVDSTQPLADRTGDEATAQLFSGWMFASSPGLNALEHPVYDVWVIACDAPDAG